MAHGEINHVEFPADDPERAMKFYSAVAGWEFTLGTGMDNYWLFRTGEGYGGAVGQRGVSSGKALRIYIEVTSIDDALAASDGVRSRRPDPVARVVTDEGQGRLAKHPRGRHASGASGPAMGPCASLAATVSQGTVSWRRRTLPGHARPASDPVWSSAAALEAGSPPVARRSCWGHPDGLRESTGKAAALAAIRGSLPSARPASTLTVLLLIRTGGLI
jgi:catechol 2,3-dioxygenase-like lactoylglutathione lyase family enzyme